MTSPRPTARTLRLLLGATMLLSILTAPTAILPWLDRSCRRVRDDETGEIVQNILWVAGFAAIAIAVITIVRAFVLSEAGNLPTSDAVGG